MLPILNLSLKGYTLKLWVSNYMKTIVILSSGCMAAILSYCNEYHTGNINITITITSNKVVKIIIEFYSLIPLLLLLVH